MLFRQLWFQVLLATLAGIALGLANPSLAAAMQPLGDGFVALVRMIIGPVVFCTVVQGIARMGDMKRLGRVVIKALVYFEAVTFVALAVALIAVNLTRPGAGMNIDVAQMAPGAKLTPAAPQGLAVYLLHIIPPSFGAAFVGNEVLPLLFASVLFAFGLVLAGEKAAPVRGLIDALAQIFYRIVGLIMWVAPLGAFGAIAFAVGRFGASSLLALGGLISEFYIVSLFFVLVILGAVARLVGVSILRLLAYFRDELLIVAATTSTETVLPRLIEKLCALGCEESVAGLVVPTGYSFNLDGTCLYLATAAIFLAQATNTHLTLYDQLALMAVLLLTSKGAAGVAGAAFVVLAGTLASSGTIPVASIGLVLGIHRLMAEALTFVNVMGNALATIVVAKWEGAVDEKTMRALVGVRLRGDMREQM